MSGASVERKPRADEQELDMRRCREQGEQAIFCEALAVKARWRKSGGCVVKERAHQFDVRVPSWRATKDISIPEDLMEEIARMIGGVKITEQTLKHAREMLDKTTEQN